MPNPLFNASNPLIVAALLLVYGSIALYGFYLWRNRK